MQRIDRYSDLRGYINAVAYNVEDPKLEDRLLNLAERAYEDPADDVLSELYELIGLLQPLNPHGLSKLRDHADMARRRTRETR